LKSFKADEEAKKLEAPKQPGIAPIPESLMMDASQLVNSLWQKTWTLAQAEIQDLRAERDELAKVFEDKSAEFDSLFAETGKLEEQLEAAQKELATVKDAALKASGEVDGLRTQLAAREQEAKSLLERAISAEQGLKKKTQEFQEVFSQAETCKAKRDALEKENSQLKSNSASQASELVSTKQKLSETEKEFRTLLERAISAEKELSFTKKSTAK
jgi:chromosome segregation ATPase